MMYGDLSNFGPVLQLRGFIDYTADEDVVDEAGDADRLRDHGPQMCGPDGRLA